MIFQGGTSLSKGYQIVCRLSEDVDFRVILKPAAKQLGKETKRKRLRDFRHAIVHALREAEFYIPEKAVRVFYEGRFMRIDAEFKSTQKSSYLKPHIAIECFVGELALMPKINNITSLIKLTLSEMCDHSNFSVPCVALDETAAEKWVALTRRIANTQEKTRPSDQHLVRHLYDLYHLKNSKSLTGEYSTIVKDIMEKDRVQFKKYNAAYASDPLDISEKAIDLLSKDKQWENHWDIFLSQMVYEENKPSFATAYSHLQSLSAEIFNTLRK